MYAIEVSKFTTSWRLSSMAASICIALGWHRQPTPEGLAADPSSEIKRALFWFAYALDKAFSLRFGRASSIQEYDITVPRALGESIQVPDDAWRDVINQWLVHAGIMGKAYEQLYSPTALAGPPERRVQSARELIEMLEAAAESRQVLVNQVMHQIRIGSSGLNTTGRPGLSSAADGSANPYSIEMCALSDDVLYYSARTLIYRAIPNTTGSPGTMYPECLEAARKAMVKHHECMALAEDNAYAKAGYIHW